MGLKLTSAEKLYHKGFGAMQEKVMSLAKMNVPTVGPKCNIIWYLTPT